MLGYGAATCSYADWLHADLIVLFGSNVANNQPVAVKYLGKAKENGARDRRGQSVPRAGPCALLGAVDRRRARCSGPSSPTTGSMCTRVAIARFSSACCERSSRRSGVDETFVRERTVGFEQARDEVLRTDWDGHRARKRIDARRESCEFARLLMSKPNAIFVWSMGLTQHARGVDTIGTLINVGARARLARPCQSRPGADSRSFGRAGRRRSRMRSDRRRGDRRAVERGLGISGAAGARMDRAGDDRSRRGRRRRSLLDCRRQLSRDAAGRRTVASARSRVRVSAFTTTSCCRSSMLVDSDGDVLLLPAATRYESEGGGTETSTERRIIFSPEIPGRRIGSAKPEWWVFGEAMARAFPNRANYIRFDSAAAIRDEIARAIPLYQRHRNARRPRAIRFSGAARRSLPTGGLRPRTARRALLPSGSDRTTHDRTLASGAATAGPLDEPAFPRLHASRQAVQFDDSARRRSADRRRPRRRLRQRRRSRTSQARGSASGCACRRPMEFSTEGCVRRPSNRVILKSTGPRATRCSRERQSIRTRWSRTTTRW